MNENIFNINKRIREMNLGHGGESPLPLKLMNLKKGLPDITAQVFFQGTIFEMNLFSDVFSAGNTKYAVLFILNYDFTQQSRKDLLQIHQNYSKLVEYSAVPIVVTHDRPNVHYAYGTPGFTSESLNFEPSFILASDSTDRLISTLFGAIDFDTYNVKRSVHIIDDQYNLILSHHIPSHKTFLPMKLIFDTINHDTK
ncbi:hypothetical protein G6F70_003108 [Rhizopus microsporus]|uniref:Alkyl hydroperoxide reductase subunit C/ Thiol specific antioxidant domain-containing protein n=2 Tax=Rhizopus TaxID=4842 RepID=A0A367JFC0_RHIAZ|nr:hypothetical protein G6F71_002995 [Rhizopus microsporus]KAG1201478.1 hypothetical protein G6F70_003108 [Rhizopus microsporus]KAG1213538.1 hypothetical protein G6F69_002723 [Rhizopus microsporus]RCH88607.1 hypothetical protein CU097_010926 [Rhizopus azygosporus]